MAITLDVSNTFPDGTDVGAYLTWTQPADTRSAPSGTADATATVASGSATFAGLEEDESYFAIGQVAGVWTRYGFTINQIADTFSEDQSVLQGEIDDLNDELDGVEVTFGDAIDAVEADVAVVKEAPLNVRQSEYGALGDGSNDDTAEIQAALTVCNNVEQGEVYVPPGEYNISSALTIKEGVGFFGAGSYATVFTATNAAAKVYFDQSVGGGRGPLSGGFRVNMAEVATTGMQLDLCVNRSFEDLRVDSPATNGIAMLLNDAQNCDFDGVDVEGKGGGGGPAGTRGLVFDRGASGNNFFGFRANDFTSYHVSYRMTDTAWTGVDRPRHNYLWGVMIERQDPPYVGLIYHRAGSDNGIVGGNLSLGTAGDTSPGATYPIVVMDNSGEDGPGAETVTNPVFRDLKINGEVWAGTRWAIAFQTTGSFFYGNVTDCNVGNVRHLMSFDNEGSHRMRDEGNFVDSLATSRYTGSTAYMRANFTSGATGTLNPDRGKVSYFYAGGSSNLTRVEPTVETGFVITIQFYASRTVKHGTDNIYLAGAADFAATANDILRLVHDGNGDWHEISRTVK